MLAQRLKNTVYGNRSFLLYLYCIALLVRLAFFIFVLGSGKGSWIVFDSNQYHQLACNIIQGKGFVDELGMISAYRLPGYPLILSMLYYLGNNSLTIALAMQIVITSLIPCALFVVAHLLSFGRLAHIVGVFSALHLGSIMYSGMIATEAWFILFFLLFFILLAVAIEDANKSRWWMIGCGALLGCASLTRPVGHWALFMTIVFILVLPPIRNRIQLAGTCSLGWLLVVLPWLIRNYKYAGAFFFHTLPGLHFLQYSAAEVYMQQHQCAYLPARTALIKQWQHNIHAQEQLIKRRLNDFEQCCIAQKIAVARILSQPATSLKYALVQLCKTVCSLHATHLLYLDAGWHDYDRHVTLRDKMSRYLFPSLHNRWWILLIYYDIITHFLLLCGVVLWVTALVVRAARFSYLYWFLTGFTVLFWGLTLAYGNARLRLPIEPFLLLMAVQGFGYLLITKKRGNCNEL